MLRARPMRYFTDAAAAELEKDQQAEPAPYELILGDGRRIAIPDYASLLSTIAHLEVDSWRLRINEGANTNGHRIRRA